MDSSLTPALVRGRCACGKRYRIRNGRPGVTVRCPNCQRPILIDEQDWRAALVDENLVPLQDVSIDIREAIPVDFGELALAPKGARPGLTGARVHDHEEALLMTAMHGWTTPSVSDERRNWSFLTPKVELERTPRSFTHDLLVSFVFAGRGTNALKMAIVALASTLTVLFYYVLLLFPILIFLAIPLFAFAYLVQMQFFWSTLTNTAEGDDELPWVDSNWSLWENSIKPALWLTLVSVFCSAPAAFAFATLPDSPGRLNLCGGLLLAGWFFWPVGVMSIAVGNSILYARPDWLVRSIIAVGPLYVFAWLLAMLVLGAWVATILAIVSLIVQGGSMGRLLFPPLIFTANVYCGYILFRNLGLLYRHYSGRFPWRI